MDGVWREWRRITLVGEVTSFGVAVRPRGSCQTCGPCIEVVLSL